MSSHINIEDQEFEQIDFTEKALARGNYENCKFLNCNLSRSDLGNFSFTECEFIDCDLSMVHIKQTTFNDICFVGCKMLGLRFDLCNDFLLSFRFKGCMLNLSSFYGLGLKGTIFENCKLHEVDFVETDLTASTFDGCDLQRAIFDHSILEKADFRAAYNFNIDPERNKLKKTKFSRDGVVGLLGKYDIVVD